EGCADLAFDKKNTTARVHLRAMGLENELSSNDLFKAILHIAQNRGQRLTRGVKDDNKNEAKERTKTAVHADSTRGQLNALGRRLCLTEAATPGQLLYDRLQGGRSTK